MTHTQGRLGYAPGALGASGRAGRGGEPIVRDNRINTVGAAAAASAVPPPRLIPAGQSRPSWTRGAGRGAAGGAGRRARRVL